MQNPFKPVDRHCPATSQLNIRVPTTLRAEFSACCAHQGAVPSHVLVALMQNYVTLAKEAQHGA